MIDIVNRIESITTDWDGSRMVDGEEPRIIPSCGELRQWALRIKELEEANQSPDDEHIQTLSCFGTNG